MNIKLLVLSDDIYTNKINHFLAADVQKWGWCVLYFAEALAATATIYSSPKNPALKKVARLLLLSH